MNWSKPRPSAAKARGAPSPAWGRANLSTRRAPVLFVPEIARGLIGHFVAAIRGSSQYRQSSFLLKSAGQQVFPAGFSIAERPHIPKAMGSAPFDDEGVATRDRELIADGDAHRLHPVELFGAKARDCRPPATPAARTTCWSRRPSPAAWTRLLTRLGTGLLVTELMGQGVNMVTGDYSRGAAGFWVENGAIQYPVAEITIAGNLRDMLKGIAAAGDDVDARGGTRVGSILLQEMTIAGE